MAKTKLIALERSTRIRYDRKKSGLEMVRSLATLGGRPVGDDVKGVIVMF